jgi:Tol biopolymer transport system component
LALIDVASGAVSAIPATEGALSPAWSPSGQGIVFTQPVPATGSVELFRAAPDGTNREQLTSSEASVAADPSWSPDGAQIAYVYMNDVDFALELRVLKLQDKSTRVLVEGDSEQGISDPTWSPDGRSIAFAMADFTIPFHIFVTPVDTPAPRELTSPDATSQAPSWSPDGTRIAYSGNQAGNFELYLMNADGTRHVRVTNNEDFDEQPAWRP